MIFAERVKKLVKKMRYKATDEAYDKALDSFLRTVEEYQQEHLASDEPNIWRIIMKSRMTKLAAVAAIAIMVLLPLSYGATKLIKRFITIFRISPIEKVDFPYYNGKALSPDGKYFAGITQASELVIIDTATGEQRNLSEHCYGPVVWSDDGSEIAIAGLRQEKPALIAVSRKTGKTRTLLEDPPNAFWLADWSPDGKWILGVSIPNSGVQSQVLVNLETKEETVLAEKIQGRPSTFFSPDGAWFTYITQEVNKYILNLRQIDGPGRTKYTDFPGEILQPMWSPDGTYIVFTGVQKGVGRLRQDLWALRIEGDRFVGPPSPILPDVEQMQFFNWSQNGQLAYRNGFELGGIFVLPVDPKTGKATGQPRQLVRSGGMAMHCWSPDGEQIAVIDRQEGWELSFISSDSGETIRKISLPEIQNRGHGISWSPDGKYIAFSGENREKRSGIFLVTVKTGEVRLLVPLDTRIPHVHPTWAPDSKAIAYVYPVYDSDIYIVNVEDGRLKRLTRPVEEREFKDRIRRAVFAPDGRSVTYKAGRRILATIIDGQETKEILHLKDNSFGIFDWAPDGCHIVFTADTTSEVWCAPIDDEPFKICDISNVGEYAQARRPKWSPKGDAIAFVVNCQQYQYWVIENFLPPTEVDGL
ncbi:MAG: PD40 domain-containing protein [Sedimentisphaerales bacterium]|nr:PD40 domain-containing protein [Sedimentisphaerales bacterium]